MSPKVGELRTLEPAIFGPGTDVNDILPTASERGIAYIVSSGGEFLGALLGPVLLSKLVSFPPKHIRAFDVMTPRDDLPHVNPDTDVHTAAALFEKARIQELPVLESDRLVASLPLGSVLSALSDAFAPSTYVSYQERRAMAILQSLNEGVVMVDKDLVIREFNPAAERFMEAKAAERIGKKRSWSAKTSLQYSR